MSEGFFRSKRRTRRGRGQRAGSDAVTRPVSRGSNRRRPAARGLKEHLRRVLGSPAARAARGRPGAVALALACAVAGFAIAPRVHDGISLLLRGDSLQLSSVRVIGTRVLTPAEVAATSGVPRGSALADVDVEATEVRLLAHPWIEEARVLRRPPSRLVIWVVERSAEAVVADPSRSQWWAVDAEGTPFAAARAGQTDALPRLRGAGDLVPGERNPALARAVTLAGSLAGQPTLPALRTIDVAAGPDLMGFQLAGLATVFWVGAGDLEAQIGRLVEARGAAPSQIEGAVAMDLRFAGQVVLRDEPGPAAPSQAAGARRQRS